MLWGGFHNQAARSCLYDFEWLGFLTKLRLTYEAPVMLLSHM